jgi:hypothetical protein
MDRNRKEHAMRSAFLILILITAGVFAFGLPDAPDVPDVPDVDLPDIEIPGLEILEGLQTELDGIIDETSALTELIPELGVLDEVSAKLSELQETDPPGIAELQSEIDALRQQLVDARSEIQSVSDRINGEVGGIKASIDSFMDGLPIPQ